MSVTYGNNHTTLLTHFLGEPDGLSGQQHMTVCRHGRVCEGESGLEQCAGGHEVGSDVKVCSPIEGNCGIPLVHGVIPQQWVFPIGEGKDNRYCGRTDDVVELW
jgi:hypothetical protein